ncbi:MAG TPA: hypothetical protein VEI98_11105 [Xanthobacteraceae bacterium]|nr:hypothetical protein [Xanthobacteraceae bacterium]
MATVFNQTNVSLRREMQCAARDRTGNPRALIILAIEYRAIYAVALGVAALHE